MRRLRLTEPGYAFPLQLWPQVAAAKLRLTEIPVRLIYNDPTRHFGGTLDDVGQPSAALSGCPEPARFHASRNIRFQPVPESSAKRDLLFVRIINVTVRMIQEFSAYPDWKAPAEDSAVLVWPDPGRLSTTRLRTTAGFRNGIRRWQNCGATASSPQAQR